MARKKKEKTPAESFTDLDSYEEWLEKQPQTRVKAKSGFISAEEEEAGS
jgi:hypothetical protein